MLLTSQCETRPSGWAGPIASIRLICTSTCPLCGHTQTCKHCTLAFAGKPPQDVYTKRSHAILSICRTSWNGFFYLNPAAVFSKNISTKEHLDCGVVAGLWGYVNSRDYISLRADVREAAANLWMVKIKYYCVEELTGCAVFSRRSGDVWRSVTDGHGTGETVASGCHHCCSHLSAKWVC